MATGFSTAPRKEGTWKKLVIFVALYVLLLESIVECVLVLYLFGNRQVDSKMTLSLALALVSSFLSVPLSALQSLVAWQYNRIGGFGTQKTVLHNVCTYVLRLELMVWLATSVSGLVVVAQQVYCLPQGTDARFWRVGLSCVFHRASVVVSVVSLVTVCTLYCARELCDRPYDVSLIGIYKRQVVFRDESIMSGNSWDSNGTLKNEILNLCRQHDGKTKDDYWSPDPLANRVNCHPSIRHPAPVRLRPQLRLNTQPGSEHGEISSGTTVSPNETLTHISPGSQSVTSELFPISRTSTVMTSHTASESRGLTSESVRVPEVPSIPERFSNHRRQKSSLSSLRRFLPKAIPLFLPLSADPQIRALTDPNSASDVEKQVATSPAVPQGDAKTSTEQDSSSPSPDSSSSPACDEANAKGLSTTALGDGQSRTMTMNSADAPEVVPAEPSQVRRSQTACLTPAARSIHHPHHPNYVPGPTNHQAQPFSASTYSLSWRQNLQTVYMQPDSLQRTSSRHTNIVQYPSRSSSYQFDQAYIPRHTQTQYHPHYTPPDMRWCSQRFFDPSRAMPAVPRRTGVDVIYPSTRRARSSTHGGFNASGPLSCIIESTSDPQVSVEETKARPISSDASRIVLGQNSYRGANRTSLSFY